MSGEGTEYESGFSCCACIESCFGCLTIPVCGAGCALYSVCGLASLVMDVSCGETGYNPCRFFGRCGYIGMWCTSHFCHCGQVPCDVYGIGFEGDLKVGGVCKFIYNDCLPSEEQVEKFKEDAKTINNELNNANAGEVEMADGFSFLPSFGLWE